jgi:peptidoglycan/LPS O-acetylase OafA/YrhL
MQVSTRSQGLDLIRAVAVLTVVLFHAAVLVIGDGPTPSWVFPIGGVAVEAFYGLSGYLIGRILLGLVDTATPGVWLNFMCRRWVRTLPLYFFILSVAVCLARPDFLAVVQFATMTQNLTSEIPHTTLGAFMGTSWSLTVEELFYLLFATSLLTAARLFGRRAVWPVIIAFLAFPLVLRAMTYGQPQVYFAALYNIDGIGWGVVLAQLERQGSSLFRKPVSCLVAGVGLISVAWSPYACGILSAATQWQPGTLTLAAAGCALLVAAALKVGSLGVIGPLVRAVSARSYSVYLVHWIVLTVVSAVHEAGAMSVPVSIAVFLIVTAGLSYCTHRWIEVPGMKLSSLRIRRSTAPLAA